MSDRRKILFLRAGMYISAVIFLSCAIYVAPNVPHPTSATELKEWVASYGAMAPLAYVFVYTFRPLLFIPALLLNLSAGVLFGPWLGMLLLLAGGLGCALFCYLLGRFGGGSWILENFGGTRGERLKRYLVAEKSFQKMFVLRIVPVFPYDPVSIAAGSVRVRVYTYVAATVLGMLPGAAAYNFLGASWMNGTFGSAALWLFAAFGVPLLWWLRKKQSFLEGSGESGK